MPKSAVAAATEPAAEAAATVAAAREAAAATGSAGEAPGTTPRTGATRVFTAARNTNYPFKWNQFGGTLAVRARQSFRPQRGGDHRDTRRRVRTGDRAHR